MVYLNHHHQHLNRHQQVIPNKELHAKNQTFVADYPTNSDLIIKIVSKGAVSILLIEIAYNYSTPSQLLCCDTGSMRTAFASIS
jgi:hypothetical protein